MDNLELGKSLHNGFKLFSSQQEKKKIYKLLFFFLSYRRWRADSIKGFFSFQRKRELGMVSGSSCKEIATVDFQGKSFLVIM